MNVSISRTFLQSRLSKAWTMYLIALWCTVNLATQTALAADAVSVKTPDQSFSVNVGSDGKVSVSTSTSSAWHSNDESNDDNDHDDDDDERDHSHHDHHDHDTVQISGDVHLAAGNNTRDLVSILGTATNEGEVQHDMVSVFGRTHTSGSVEHDAVAVFGSNYVNGKVGHDVVAVFGDVELGPNADVGHDVVGVFSSVKRDPAAKVAGGVQQVGPGVGGFEWLQAWVHNCLFKLRLLAFDADVMWAWWLALIALLMYALIALLFPKAVGHCVDVMEKHPGHVVLASLLTIVGIPMLMILLLITVVGIIAIPLVGISLMIAGIFGKAVILAWIGRRFVRKSENQSSSHPVIAVLVGGAIVLLLYVVPVLSFIVYKVLGLLGLGVAIYALLLEIKSRRDSKGGPGDGAKSADLADQGNTVAGDSLQSDLSSIDASASTAALTDLPRGGFWIRMVALMIDAFLIGAITSMIIHPKWFGVDTDNVVVTLLAIYGAIMWKLKGATVGDIVFKLQVIRADGRPIDWPTAIIRSLGCFLSVMVMGLGFFWIAFDEQKQAWHDKIAGTLVVYNPKGTSLV